MTNPLTPKQADREAAATEMLVSGRISRAQHDQMIAGEMDDWRTVQAFAHHAQQARLEERERCAAIAERDSRSKLAGIVGYEPAWLLFGRQIATAIRKGEA